MIKLSYGQGLCADLIWVSIFSLIWGKLTLFCYHLFLLHTLEVPENFISTFLQGKWLELLWLWRQTLKQSSTFYYCFPYPESWLPITGSITGCEIWNVRLAWSPGCNTEELCHLENGSSPHRSLASMGIIWGSSLPFLLFIILIMPSIISDVKTVPS